MAIDSKAVISFGFWPTIAAELDQRVISFGYYDGTFVPAVPVIYEPSSSLSVRIRSRLKI